MSRRKKILFISNYFAPHIGGVENHIKFVSEELLSKNFNISLITKKHNLSLKTFEKSGGLNIYRINYPKIKLLGLFVIWFRNLSHLNLYIKADVIHVHDVFVWILPLRILLFWKKFYITFHGWEGKYPISLKSIFQKRLAQFLSNDSIAVGKYINKIYGIEVSNITYGGTSLSNGNRNFRKTPKIVYVGRLSEELGVLELINYFKAQKGRRHIQFYGDGVLRKQCSSVGKVYGIQDKKTLLKALRNADICICGGYLSILDSLAMKCMTLTYVGSPIRAQIFDKTPFSKYIYKFRRPSDIFNIVSTYESDLSVVKQIAQRGFSWVINESWEKVALLYFKLWYPNS